MWPDPLKGLSPEDRPYVINCLLRVQHWAAGPRSGLELEHYRLVAGARVPILKLKLRRGPEVGSCRRVPCSACPLQPACRP